MLTQQQVRYGHALGFPGALEYDVRHGQLAIADLALELGARQPDLVGLSQRLHVLRRWSCQCLHGTSPLASVLEAFVH